MKVECKNIARHNFNQIKINLRVLKLRISYFFNFPSSQLLNFRLTIPQICLSGKQSGLKG